MNIEELRDYCLSLPQVTEDVKWGSNLCFMVINKIFCITDVEGPFRASFKVPVDDFDELSNRTYLNQAPYLARGQWVIVEHEDALSTKEWKQFVKRSYDLIVSKLPKKKQEELGV